ncbi:unnamed protein product [Rotaria sordida]|uniref:Uncharacterized protein n=1 Tax=Rotaria sordida TaxID=392033 RepID=A0A814CBQ8_9BILA|nr:unnamed protein product [Rotaria sordida]CAF0900063.1 unnamed protein product [Rotaria sordida]CAF0939365.1 unnamed protein product [Rotaria sordida]CAF3572492.1 unnamed protein product [Rotaria sordida]CAF3597868.1 unnamed protein product [Rotaria sordida]
METKSQYQIEYVEKPVIPIAFRPLKDSHIDLTESAGPLSSLTTTRAHFKQWDSARSQPYAELPSVAGHVLFPGSSRSFNTSTGSTFKPFPKISQAKPIPRLENSGSLKLSGSMDLRTNYRESYIPPEPSSSRSAPTERKDKSKEDKVYTRRPMYTITQTSLDFRPYPNHRPSPPADMEPFVSQITLGNSLTPAVTKSQYRADYEGIDTSRHLRQPAVIPKDKKPYVAPIQKMDTISVTQRDFQPLDITTLPRIRLIPMRTTLSVNEQHAPMESITMSRYHYQPYDSIKSKRKYGEPMPNIYIPPISKFEGLTTTGETYKGQPGHRARACMPEIKMINQIGEHDHKTNYRVDYHSHGLTLCAAKAYAIAQNKQKSTTTISAQ